MRAQLGIHELALPSTNPVVQRAPSRRPGCAIFSEISSHLDGTFMEPRGRNRWQSGASRAAAKPEKPWKSVAVGCTRLQLGAHGKEGVDGSSPEEGFID